MSDLISKSALMARIESEYREWGEDYDVEQVLGDIEDAVTIEAEPVKHGRWEYNSFADEWRCSKCFGSNAKKANYCPNCGAIMDEEVEE